MLARIRPNGPRPRRSGLENPRLRRVSTNPSTPLRAAFSRAVATRRGDGEDARAGSEIEDRARRGRWCPVQREEAAARALVRAGAEGAPGVEHDLHGSARRACRHMGAADEKPPGPDRRSITLHLRHPVGLGQWGDRDGGDIPTRRRGRHGQADAERSLIGPRPGNRAQPPAAVRPVAETGHRGPPGGVFQRGLEHRERAVAIVEPGEEDLDAPARCTRLRPVRQSAPSPS